MVQADDANTYSSRVLPAWLIEIDPGIWLPRQGDRNKAQHSGAAKVKMFKLPSSGMEFEFVGPSLGPPRARQ